MKPDDIAKVVNNKYILQILSTFHAKNVWGRQNLPKNHLKEIL